jgi:hypothetical protein
MATHPALCERPTPRWNSLFDDFVIAAYVPRRRRRASASPMVGAVENEVLARIDGYNTVGEIAGLLDLAPREVFAMVQHFENLGIASVGSVSGRYAIVDPEERSSDVPTAPGVPVARLGV